MRAIALQHDDDDYYGMDLSLAGVTDTGGELMGFRLYEPDDGRTSRLYLSRDDALDAWACRCIEWED
jgi:hypothetical protein